MTPSLTTHLIAPRREQIVQLDEQPALFGDGASPANAPEQFRLALGGRAVIRQVLRRDGTRAETVYPIERQSRRVEFKQEELAALADASFLQRSDWPSSPSRGATIRSVDLFSGCGIMTLGAWDAARAAGLRFEPVAALDINVAAAGVYKRNFPMAAVRTVPVESVLNAELGQPASDEEKHFLSGIGEVELLVGGPPCQGHSSLNNHTRRNDPKNRLYERMARFAELARPRHIIIENVSAVLHDRGRVVEQTISSLLHLGYAVDHGIAEVSSIGVPQQRRRHVLVASLTRLPNVRHTLAEFARQPRTVRWAIKDLLKNKHDTTIDTVTSPSRSNQKRIDWLFMNDEHLLPNRLRPDCHKLKKHSYKSVYGRMYWDRPCQTITTGFTSMGQGRYVHPAEPRTITPHEAARLQFIPDFFDFGDQIGRTSLSEMIGNAVPTKLTYVFALELFR